MQISQHAKRLAKNKGPQMVVYCKGCQLLYSPRSIMRHLATLIFYKHNSVFSFLSKRAEFL